MSEDLVRYALAATPAQLLALTLEDMAICQAWHHVLLDDPEKAEGMADLPARIATWTADKVHLQRATEGARQQPLLRKCLDALEERGVDRLHRDELDFLFFLHALIVRAKVRSQFQRPLDCIAPHIEKIVARREQLPVVPGLTNLRNHVLVVTESTVRSAKSREIRLFGGLPQAFRGPVLSHNGTLKIVGDVPDGAAVVVEGGTCYVSGYVLGRLLVGEHAEVQENIAGLLISQRGNIRARGIINRATVISKGGRIACGSVQSPDLVYAGTQIRIRESALQGTFFAPRIRVQEDITGGLWHVTDLLRAKTFVHGEKRPLDIVLRLEIGHEDFGEALPREAKTMLRAANRLQARVDYLTQLRDRQAEEAEHYASTALLYMCSGTSSQEELQQVDVMKRRRAFLLRVMTGLHLLTKSLSAQLHDGRLDNAEGNQMRLAVQRAIKRSLTEVTRELAELRGEGNFPEELEREWEELMALHASSSGNPASETLSRAILRFHESRKSWQEEIMDLDGRISALQEKLAGGESRKALITRAQAEGTSQPVLLQLVRAARQRGPEDPVVKRMDTPFVRRMLQLLKKRNEWVTRYGDEAKERSEELAALHKKLRDNFNIDPVAHKPRPCVQGAFRAGVRLHAEELQPTGNGQVNGAALVTGDSGENTVTYEMWEGMITSRGH